MSGWIWFRTKHHTGNYQPHNPSATATRTKPGSPPMGRFKFSSSGATDEEEGAITVDHHESGANTKSLHRGLRRISTSMPVQVEARLTQSKVWSMCFQLFIFSLRCYIKIFMMFNHYSILVGGIWIYVASDWLWCKLIWILNSHLVHNVYFSTGRV